MSRSQSWKGSQVHVTYLPTLQMETLRPEVIEAYWDKVWARTAVPQPLSLHCPKLESERVPWQLVPCRPGANPGRLTRTPGKEKGAGTLGWSGVTPCPFQNQNDIL